MDDAQAARELVTAAKELTAGTWGLPENLGDVAKIEKMVDRMRNGKPPLPGKKDPGNALYGLLGDDNLFDRFLSEEEYYYKGCAEAVRARVRELAKQPRNSYRDPHSHDMLVALAKKI